MKRIVLVLTLCLAMLMPAFGASQDTIQRPRLPQRYLNYSGVSSLNIVNLGYTYSFKDNMHMIEIGALSFRYMWFGMSILNFEMGFVEDENTGKPTLSKWVGYKPSIQFYAPISKCLSISPYVGTSVDCTYLGKYLVKGYEYEKDKNFFVDVIGGVSLYMTFVPQVPIEIRAEYRYPAIQNTRDPLSEGFYISGHLYFSKPFGMKH